MDKVIESYHYDRVVMDLLVYDQLLEEKKAVMVIYLALQYFRCVNGTDSGDWFKCSYGEIKQELGTSSDTFTHGIRRLVDVSFLEVKQTTNNVNYYRFVERVFEKMKYIVLHPLVIKKLFGVSKSALRLYLALHVFRIEQKLEGKAPILVKREDIKIFVGIANNTISSSREDLYGLGLIDYERSSEGKAPMFYYILEE
ncbi:hypothetical protein [Brevibacillus reuszeri]|uniref:hypothetical protein n=1 Tax=Brevibacillus reuszeri TaxID=54915 RepID=UPI003D1E6753